MTSSLGPFFTDVSVPDASDGGGPHMLLWVYLELAESRDFR